MNKNEILGYLRTSTGVDDKRLLELIDDACREVDATVSPRTIYRLFDCTVTDDELIIGDTVFRSRRLCENLKGCDKVFIIAATLGTESDRLLRTYASNDTARMAVLQACLASKTEEVCDSIEDEIRAQGYSLRQRFSPGYYDLDISENAKIFALMDISKRTGLTLTPTYQMLPTKSVTAFIGAEK
jgi:hypothetical protein